MDMAINESGKHRFSLCVYDSGPARDLNSTGKPVFFYSTVFNNNGCILKWSRARSIDNGTSDYASS